MRKELCIRFPLYLIPLTKAQSPASLASQLLYLAVYLLQRPSKDGLQPRPPVIGQVAGEQLCLFQEHAQLRSSESWDSAIRTSSRKLDPLRWSYAASIPEDIMRLLPIG